MLGILRYAAHIVAGFSLCSGCSLLFGGTALDAPAEESPTAIIDIALPFCDDTIYSVSGQASSSPAGTYIAEYRWEVIQDGAVIGTITGSAQAWAPTGAHILGGTAETYSLNPSLWSSPSLLKVALTGTSGANQVYQFGFAVQDATDYELSFVVASDGEGTMSAALIGHLPTFPNLGLFQEIATSDVAQRHVLPLTTTQSNGNARVKLDFNTVTSFYVDNVQLRKVGGPPLLTNEGFDMELAPWNANFAGGGEATLEKIPLGLSGFPITTLVLVVVDSAGNESEPATTTIGVDQCNP